MSRQGLKTEKEAALQVEQVNDHAFHVFGWEIRLFKEIDLTFPVTTNAREPSTIQWEKVFKPLESKGNDPWRADLALTIREKQHEVEANVNQYLLVGFVIQSLPGGVTSKHENQKKQMAAGPLSTNLGIGLYCLTFSAL